MASASRTSADVERWIADAQNGDDEAVGRALNMCRRYLLMVAKHKRAPELAAKVAPSDLVQETFLEARRDWAQFHGCTEPELLAWLRGILLHNIANAERHYDTDKRQVDREVSLDDLFAGEDLLDPGESPSSQFLAHERDEQVEQAIAQLPEHYQQILWLHIFERLTFPQIAEKLGHTADAVRRTYGRAVAALASFLDSPHESA